MARITAGGAATGAILLVAMAVLVVSEAACQGAEKIIELADIGSNCIFFGHYCKNTEISTA